MEGQLNGVQEILVNLNARAFFVLAASQFSDLPKIYVYTKF